jgi:hypothetical protein
MAMTFARFVIHAPVVLSYPESKGPSNFERPIQMPSDTKKLIKEMKQLAQEQHYASLGECVFNNFHAIIAALKAVEQIPLILEQLEDIKQVCADGFKSPLDEIWSNADKAMTTLDALAASPPSSDAGEGVKQP